MADSKRALVGIHNARPGASTRGYVILGVHTDWSSAPATLTLHSTEHAVVRETRTRTGTETYDFMVRRFQTADLQW
jgi:hypothetical protein